MSAIVNDGQDPAESAGPVVLTPAGQQQLDSLVRAPEWWLVERIIEKMARDVQQKILSLTVGGFSDLQQLGNLQGQLRQGQFLLAEINKARQAPQPVELPQRQPTV